MGSGGARNRSGPAPDPGSSRSEKRGFSLSALPSEGRKGHAPAFPLPRREILTKVYIDSEPVTVVDVAKTKALRARELEIWREAWRTPQACAWEREPWRWPVLAEYCRLKTVVEADPSSTAALVAQLHRYRDQLGLTPAGLKENGWAIQRDEVAAKRDARRAEVTEMTEPAERPTRRMRAVSSD